MATVASPEAEKTGLVTSTDPSRKKHNGRWKAMARCLFLDPWALEYLAMIIAVAALVTIALILILYPGRPLDHL